MISARRAGPAILNSKSSSAQIGELWWPGRDPCASSGTDIVLGALALLLAAALAHGTDQRLRARRTASHPRDPVAEQEPWTRRMLAAGSAPIVFAAGLVVNLPGAAYLVALKDIAAGHHSTAVDVFQVVVFNLIMFTLAEVPLFFLAVAPARADRLVKRMNQVLSANGRRIAIWVSGTLGVFLVARGVAHS